MALGKRQREVLGWYADLLKRNPGIVELRVSVGRYQYLTREMGGGSGHPVFVSAFECYEGEPPARMRLNWIATCQYDYSAEAKTQEIAAWLIEQGCSSGSIKIAGRS